MYFRDLFFIFIINITFYWDVTQYRIFDVLLTVHLSIILVINQLNAQNLLL